jgi:biopolymer transport protein TolR
MNTSLPPSHQPIADINVTPMVDIMMVLLIVFMVAAPMLQQGVPVALPQTQAAPIEETQQKLNLSIDSARKIYINDIEIPYAELSDKLSQNIKIQQDKQAYLFADRTLPYGFVVDIMAILKNAGVENIAMVTEEPPPKK